MVEYALLVGLIAIVLVVAITFFAGELNDSFSSFGTAVDGTT
jgi:Flp pilus assembly pilin Flp